MRYYSDEEIRLELTEFATSTGQPDLHFVISYAIGYYGSITTPIWRVILSLRREGIIK